MQCNLCRSTLRGNKFSETIDLGIRFSEKEHLSILHTRHSRRSQGQLLSI